VDFFKFNKKSKKRKYLKLISSTETRKWTEKVLIDIVDTELFIISSIYLLHIVKITLILNYLLFLRFICYILLKLL